MTEIVKICKIHGSLTKDNISIQYSKYKDKKYPYYNCLQCIRIKRRRIYQNNKEKYQKYALMMRKKHYEKCIERDRKYKREKLLSIPEYNLMHEKQGGLCAICNQPETSKSHSNRVKNIGEIKNKRLAIDHCHNTGKIRGLLCHKCNTGLGAFKDSTEYLNAAIEYLKSNH